MKRLVLTGLIAIALQTAVVASEYSSIQIGRSNLSSVVANSYIRGVIAQGDITRWNTSYLPLNVYIQTQGVPAEYIVQLKRAYKNWQTATDGEVTFALVNSPDDADLKCVFTKDIPDTSEDTVGVHQFQYRGDEIADSTIHFRFTDKYGRQFSSDLFYTIALHEIGHSLGLAGHSSNPNDLMYPVSTARNTGFSKRDLTTFKLLYKIIPDRSNIEFDEEDREGLYTKAQVVGGESRLKEDAATAAEINKRITPNDPNTRLRLAMAYQEKGSYTQAITEYKAAVAMIDSRDVKSAVYCQITECYIKMKNFSAARNCANYANSHYPNDETKVLPARIMLANGQKQAAVKALLPLWNNHKNKEAGLMLKNIYLENKNNSTIKKLIESNMQL